MGVLQSLLPSCSKAVNSEVDRNVVENRQASSSFLKKGRSDMLCPASPGRNQEMFSVHDCMNLANKFELVPLRGTSSMPRRAPSPPSLGCGRRLTRAGQLAGPGQQKIRISVCLTQPEFQRVSASSIPASACRSAESWDQWVRAGVKVLLSQVNGPALRICC